MDDVRHAREAVLTWLLHLDQQQTGYVVEWHECQPGAFILSVKLYPMPTQGAQSELLIGRPHIAFEAKGRDTKQLFEHIKILLADLQLTGAASTPLRDEFERT